MARLDELLKARGYPGVSPDTWGAERRIGVDALRKGMPLGEALETLEWAMNHDRWRPALAASGMKLLRRCWTAWRERVTSTSRRDKEHYWHDDDDMPRKRRVRPENSPDPYEPDFNEAYKKHKSGHQLDPLHYAGTRPTLLDHILRSDSAPDMTEDELAECEKPRPPSEYEKLKASLGGETDRA